MARFRFARGTLPEGFTTSDVVNSRAELLAHIQRNIVYLRDLTEPDSLIIPPPPGGGGARLAVSPTSLYIVRIRIMALSYFSTDR